MTEELTVDVRVVTVGESHAAEQMGGTLLHLLSSVTVRALPANIPQGLELDVTPLSDFDAMLYVRDLRIPAGATLVTDGDEPIARVQPPRVEEEPVLAEVEEAEVEEGAEVPEVEGAEAEAPAAEGAEES
jgi:large subunit ribosomal protein L25